jgi:hypothetical protein
MFAVRNSTADLSPGSRASERGTIRTELPESVASWSLSFLLCGGLSGCGHRGDGASSSSININININEGCEISRNYSLISPVTQVDAGSKI